MVLKATFANVCSMRVVEAAVKVQDMAVSIGRPPSSSRKIRSWKSRRAIVHVFANTMLESEVSRIHPETRFLNDLLPP